MLKAKWETARGGTLIVRHLDELPDPLQDLLAGWIDAEKAGAAQALAPPRIVATASDPPQVMRIDGRLTAPLYRALDAIAIDVPPLRDRSLDLADLANALAREIAPRYGKVVERLSCEAVALLYEYRFPGNVSELARMLERAVAGMQGTRIEISDLRFE